MISLSSRFSLLGTLLASSALGLSATLLSAPAFASGTATSNLNVSASINPSCSISSTIPLSFGIYNPADQTDLAASVDISVTCTTGTPAHVLLGQGGNPGSGSTEANPLRQMSDGVSGRLQYNLYQDSGHATVWGNTTGTGKSVTGSGTPQPVTIYGKVPQAQTSPAGTYGDTVVATVNF